LFEPASFVRAVVFGIIYAGIEYRYVNRSEADWTKKTEGFFEKPVFWVIPPYQLYLLLPLFITAAFALPLTAWAANTFLIAVVEDIAYFAWRGKSVMSGEWTTTLFGSFRLGRFVIPVWWPLDLIVAAALYLIPL
jgi:hypothetical protein